MKYPNFLSMALIAVLMVTLVSCTTLQGTQDEYEERPSAGRRVILNDPYYNNNTTYYVRDPYTGMLYEVRPYGASPYSTYGYGYDPYYNRRNSRYYRSTAPSTQTSPEQRRQAEEGVRRTRESVFGKKQ